MWLRYGYLIEAAQMEAQIALHIVCIGALIFGKGIIRQRGEGEGSALALAESENNVKTHRTFMVSIWDQSRVAKAKQNAKNAGVAMQCGNRAMWQR